MYMDRALEFTKKNQLVTGNLQEPGTSQKRYVVFIYFFFKAKIL